MPCALFPIAYCPLPIASLPTLAQTGLDLRAFVYLGLLLIIAVVGGILIFAAKRRVLSDKDDESDSGAGLMATLDRMLKNGEISREEYDLTRRTIIEKTLEKLDKAKGDGQNGPDQ